jgi:hypothetical protein
MELSEIKDRLADDDSITYPDYEDALIGFTCGWGRTRAVYEWGKCIEILMVRDGMTYEEALEWFERNTAGAYNGEHTPEIVNTGYSPEPVPDGCLRVWSDSYG